MFLQVKGCGTSGGARERANFLRGAVKGERTGGVSLAEEGWEVGRSPVWVEPFFGANPFSAFLLGGPDVTFGFPQFPVSV